MKRFVIILIVLLEILLASSILDSSVESNNTSNINFIDDASVELEKIIRDNNDRYLKNLYGSELYYTPIWIKQNGLTDFGNELMEIIDKDKTLLPSMQSSKLYKKIQNRLEEIKKNKSWTISNIVALELEMSALYKAYVDYMIYGGIDWDSFKSKLLELKKNYGADFGWVVYTPKKTAISVLIDAINLDSLKDGIKKAEPTRFQYHKLKKYLLKYIEIAQNKSWQKLTKYTSKIKPTEQNKIIPAIRHNLALEGDLGDCESELNATIYDECLQKAVKRFQLRNGIKADGIINKKTYSRINTSPSKKVALIRINMDRIKRSRERMEKVRMELNIPSYRLNIFDDDHLVDTVRVVTGRKLHPTPIFGHKVQYIIVNPWWKIPDSIVKKEMLENLIQDPYYYEKRGKILKETWNENSLRIDPGTIDWLKYKSNNIKIPYKFMQVPGSKNALGKIKFIFPNQFSVYIHDTPSKKLFFRTDRAFSHGCMRIQKPRELLKVFALYNDNIDVNDIMNRLQGTEKKIIYLKHKIPIDITYFTVFVDPYGNLNFRKDIYDYDKYTLKHYKYTVSNYNQSNTKIKKIDIQKNDFKTNTDSYKISEVEP